MNWNQIEGSWKQFKGSARARWGELTESRLEVVAGKRDQRTGRIQEAHGTAQEERKNKDLRDLQ